MQRLLSDLRFVLRQLRKAPVFAATAILMLTFGIGATTTIFSMVDGILLRPLPFRDPGRLVTIGDFKSATSSEPVQTAVTSPQVVSYIQQTHSFSALGGYRPVSFELSGAGEPAVVSATRMTPGLFTALGVAPLMGRFFTEQEDQQRAQVAVLSYTTWKTRFGANPAILGTQIDLDRKPYIVIGVMPRSFEFPLAAGILSRCELWVPMSFTPDELSPEAGGIFSYYMVARLKPGITMAQAESDVERVTEQDVRNLPPDLSNFQYQAAVYPLQTVSVTAARPLLRVLFLAVLVVLLIACTNLAGLLLVRAIRRQRETAVRLALGASAMTLLRQAILESLVLSLGGGLLGIGLAAPALAIFRHLLPTTLPRIGDISLNWPVAGFAVLLGVGTGLLCGLAPAFAAVRTNVNASLKEGGRSGSPSGNHGRLRAALVIAEIAVAMILLTASGLLLRSFQKMSSVDLGFNPDHVTTAQFALPPQHYRDQQMVDAFHRAVQDRLRQLPGMESVAVSSAIPVAGKDPTEFFVPEDYTDPSGRTTFLASPYELVGSYFRAMDIPLLRGRFFTEEDNGQSPLVVIVNRELAEHYWPGQNPVGKRIRVGVLNMRTPWLTIVGEVADAKTSAPDADAGEQFYLPLSQQERDIGSFATPDDINGNNGYIVVRSSLPAQQTIRELRSVVASIDPQLPLSNVDTMDKVVSESEAPRRFNTTIISIFAVAAALLAVLGIYGVIAFSVAARIQEMAIRMALGAQRSGIMRLVLGSGLKLAALGCVLGLAGAAAASGLLRSFLFGVSALDPLVMILAALVVFLLALAAAAMPARRAASVDPNQALRGE